MRTRAPAWARTDDGGHRLWITLRVLWGDRRHRGGQCAALHYERSEGERNEGERNEGEGNEGEGNEGERNEGERNEGVRDEDAAGERRGRGHDGDASATGARRGRFR